MENDEKQKKMNKRMIFIFAGLTLILFDVIGILAYFMSQKPHEHEYKVSETTITLYDNLLSFFDKCAEGIHPVADRVISVTFKDNYLYLVGTNTTNEIVISHKTNKDNIEDALTLFADAVPNIGETSIHSSFTITDEKLNISYEEYRGVISTSLTSNKYISYTCRYDDSNLYSYPHQLYKEDGLYEDGVKANIKDNPVLYDLYHYIIYEK